MNVNAEAVRASLEERLAVGRSLIEAAGEEIWINQKKQEMDVLSNQTSGEIERVITDWLAEQVEASDDELSVYVIRAEQYAAFLNERVDLKDFSPAGPRVDAALTAWRSKTS